MSQLNDLELDALTEVFNIGVGQAAAAMSRMVKEEVTLSVPTISFMSRNAVAEALTEDVGQRICSVSQRFEGAFDTDAILMFPESKSLEIVRMMIGEEIPLDELTDLEQEALSEIGNIILNALMGTLANVFNSEFSSSLPVFHLGTSSEILPAGSESGGEVVMLLRIDFNLVQRQIQGYVAFLLDISSMRGLKDSIGRFIGNIGRHA